MYAFSITGSAKSEKSARREIFYYDETDLMAIRVDNWKMHIGAHLKSLMDYPPSQGADTLSLKQALEKAQDMMERPNRAAN